MTKEQEKYLFEKFRKKYGEMPLGTVEFQDKPDAVVTLTNGKTIGIELTECIYDEKLMKESQWEISFNEDVVKAVEPIMPFKFYIDIELDKTTPLRQSQLKQTLSEIENVCLSEFRDLGNYEQKEITQLDVDWSEASPEVQERFKRDGYRKLPRGIQSISMSRSDTAPKSHYFPGKSGAVPNFTMDHLEKILLKKEKSLKGYKSCDQQWLLIVEGLDFYSYMKYRIILEKPNTTFDRIFMYRKWDDTVIEIK